ncbi:MHYT domain-containing protein [Salinarimonas sp.]|uniref:MHYT domain-containing protein n=1 Tax=Salinarimonas sp. TaxID=2766526 RepID=UPI0032D99B12
MIDGLDPIALTHDPWLVALSIVVAMQGAYVGLSLAGRVGDAGGLRRRALVLGAAVSLAVGIWSMHFIGMLAARLPMAVDYLVVPTVFSFLVCVMVVGAAMLFAATDQPLWLRLGAGGAGMGAGIASMHYIGMGALAGSMTMHHAPAVVALSVALAVGASAAALWLCFEAHRQVLWASAIAMGLAISGMHYTAMAGMALHAAPGTGSQFHSTLSPDGLALTVAIVAFAVSGVFLAMLTPERREAGAAAAADQAGAGAVDEPPTERDAAYAVDAVARPAPLGGAGARSRKPFAALTVERAGAPLKLPVEAIRCVRANAHYTYVRDETQEYFCGLSIGEAEAALDPARFLRVHRSHIVNLDHVTAVRRAGDNGAVDLAGCGTVPVARGRLAALKRRFEAEQSARVRPLDAAE